jgi:steroid 5-alpha reductase family enzyme
MIETTLPMVLIGSGVVTFMMFGLWLLHLRLNNASVVDPGWAYGLAITALTYALLGHGYFWRRWLGAAMAAVWGLRLGTHLLTRIVGKPEEGRYQQLRREWKTNITWKFLAFFELQAILDVLLSLPFLLAAVNPDPRLHLSEYVGASLWAAALIGESIADAQLSAFKRSSTHRDGAVCQKGLWNYSRHPNYFFEWLVWVAWALYAINSPWGWLAVSCPLLMLYFLFRVTGIPATEAQALRTKGEAYRAYQRSTNAFVPWLKKAA